MYVQAPLLSLASVAPTTTLSVDRAIMHLLDPDSNNTRLVHRDINLKGAPNEAVRDFLCRLVQSALASIDAYAKDDVGTSTTLSACWHMLASESAFVPQSRDLARRLNDIMSQKKGIVSPGDLLVVLAHDASGPMVGLLKLERNREFVHEYVTLPDGTVEVTITPTDAVIPIEHQKCAFIREPSSERDYQVELHDDQTGMKGDSAKFFHREFLQCELLTTAATLTYRFCTAAEDWRKKYHSRLPKQGIVAFTRALRQQLGVSELSFDAFAAAAIGTEPDLELRRVDLSATLRSRVYLEMEAADRPRSFRPDSAALTKLLSTITLVTSDGIKLSGQATQLEHIIDTLDEQRDDADDRLSFTVTAGTVERRFSRI